LCLGARRRRALVRRRRAPTESDQRNEVPEGSPLLIVSIHSPTESDQSNEVPEGRSPLDSFVDLRVCVRVMECILSKRAVEGDNSSNVGCKTDNKKISNIKIMQTLPESPEKGFHCATHPAVGLYSSTQDLPTAGTFAFFVKPPILLATMHMQCTFYAMRMLRSLFLLQHIRCVCLHACERAKGRPMTRSLWPDRLRHVLSLSHSTTAYDEGSTALLART